MYFNDELFFSFEQELKKHIANVEQRFGPINEAGYRTRLDPFNINNQLMEMIPGAFRSNDSPIVISDSDIISDNDEISYNAQEIKQEGRKMLNMPVLDSSNESSHDMTEREQSDSSNELSDERMITDDEAIEPVPKKARKSFPCFASTATPTAFETENQQLKQKVKDLMDQSKKQEEEIKRLKNCIRKLMIDD